MHSIPPSTNILCKKHITQPSAYVKACKEKDREKTRSQDKLRNYITDI